VAASLVPKKVNHTYKAMHDQILQAPLLRKYAVVKVATGFVRVRPEREKSDALILRGRATLQWKLCKMRREHACLEERSNVPVSCSIATSRCHDEVTMGHMARNSWLKLHKHLQRLAHQGVPIDYTQRAHHQQIQHVSGYMQRTRILAIQQTIERTFPGKPTSPFLASQRHLSWQANVTCGNNRLHHFLSLFCIQGFVTLSLSQLTTQLAPN
jgi:hypothetical protein